LEILDNNVDISKTFESVKEDVRDSAKESLGYVELSQPKPWSDE